jgi:hypothetical protein
MIADALRTLSRRAGRQLDRARRRLRRAPPGDRQTLKDRALARRFRDTFEQDLEMAGVQGLHFYIKEGVVTVYGTVRHELDRELLLSFIRQRPGVEDVVPHLSIENE